MNENLNLVEILKDCPKGTKLYSTIYGDVEFVKVSNHLEYPIEVKRRYYSIGSFTNDGRLLAGYNGECVLFPSKEQRDWSKFMNKQSETEELCESQEITKWAYISDPLPKQSKFDHKTLKLMDKVLVRNSDDNKWRCALYSYTIEGNEVNKYVTIDCSYNYHRYCIPYNEDTQHLTGTTDEAPEFYKY